MFLRSLAMMMSILVPLGLFTQSCGQKGVTPTPPGSDPRYQQNESTTLPAEFPLTTAEDLCIDGGDTDIDGDGICDSTEDPECVGNPDCDGDGIRDGDDGKDHGRNYWRDITWGLVAAAGAWTAANCLFGDTRCNPIQIPFRHPPDTDQSKFYVPLGAVEGQAVVETQRGPAGTTSITYATQATLAEQVRINKKKYGNRVVMCIRMDFANTEPVINGTSGDVRIQLKDSGNLVERMGKKPVHKSENWEEWKSFCRSTYGAYIGFSTKKNGGNYYVFPTHPKNIGFRVSTNGNLVAESWMLFENILNAPQDILFKFRSTESPDQFSRYYAYTDLAPSPLGILERRFDECDYYPVGTDEIGKCRIRSLLSVNKASGEPAANTTPVAAEITMDVCEDPNNVFCICRNEGDQLDKCVDGICANPGSGLTGCDQA